MAFNQINPLLLAALLQAHQTGGAPGPMVPGATPAAGLAPTLPQGMPGARPPAVPMAPMIPPQQPGLAPNGSPLAGLDPKMLAQLKGLFAPSAPAPATAQFAPPRPAAGLFGMNGPAGPAP